MNRLDRLAAIGRQTKLFDVSLSGSISLHLAPVTRSREFIRIASLPVRPEVDTSDLATLLTEELATPKGEMDLRPVQAAALVEALYTQGLFGPIPVGAGKTLIACLLPTILNVKRTVILTTAPLVKQGAGMMSEYREHWQVARGIHWVSYGILSRPEQSTLLDQLAPELIIADECQALSNPHAARTRRFMRFMRSHPDTLFCALSGSITKRSIKDFAHFLRLSHKDRSPLPRDWPTLTEWAEALDVSDRPRPAGALLRLNGKRGASLTNSQLGARQAVAKRLRNTIGVVGADGGSVNLPLAIRKIKAPKDSKISKALRLLEETWLRPDGEVLTYALEVAALRRSILAGGFHRWEWQPPDSWLEARSSYRSELRRFLRDLARAHLDSPKLVEIALRSTQTGTKRRSGESSPVYTRSVLARLRSLFPSYDRWQAVSRDIQTPPSRWEWVSKSRVKWCAEWATTNIGIVWVDTPAVGRTIARLAGVPYFGQGDESIRSEDGRRSIVASVRSHGTGRNLQAFSRALVFCGLPMGAVWEQLLGRLHRAGQTKAVEFDVASCYWPDFKRAREEDATYIEGLTDSDQKLLSAEVISE